VRYDLHQSLFSGPESEAADRSVRSTQATPPDAPSIHASLDFGLFSRSTLCTSFDLPPVEPISQKHIAAAGLSDRVTAASGDFFKDPLPKADVITMGMILHDWNLEKKMHLIRSAYDALPSGGAFVAIEALIDDARRENVFGLLMSLNMLIEFGEAFDYSGADFRGWCSKVGFQRFEVIHLAGPSSAAIAYK
jgi:hypothetical protein